jgi:serine protease Do
MFGSQFRSGLVLLSVWGLAMLGAAPSFADDGPGRPQATPVQKAENLIRPAVVYIEGDLSAYVGDNNGFFNDIDQPVKLTYSCTGFVVNPSGYVATAGHCADLGPEGARRDILESVVQGLAQKDPTINVDHAMNTAMSNWKVEGQNAGSPIDQTIRVARGGASGGKAQVLPARVIEARPVSQGDVALLKVEAADMPSSELAGSGDVQIGQQVVSVGYPASTEKITDFSLEPDNKDGTISAKKTDATVPVYETDAALSPGMSGGPTVGLDGRILGINSRLPAGETQAFNFIAPATGLTELLNRNGIKAELGPLDVQYRSGLDDYYAGHYTSAIATFDKILALSPTYQQAAEFKANATKAREQFGDVSTSSGSHTLWYVLGAVVLLVAAVAAILLLRRRRGPASAGPGGAPPFPYNPSQGSPPAWSPTVYQPAGTPAPPNSPPSVPPGTPQAVPTQPDAADQPRPTAPVADPADSAGGVASTFTAEKVPNSGTGVSRYCTHCGSQHRDTERFCPQCGHAVT